MGAGLTIRQLAERAGTGHSAISKIEQGRQVPTVARLERLVAACGYTLVFELVENTSGSASAPASSGLGE